MSSESFFSSIRLLIELSIIFILRTSLGVEDIFDFEILERL